MLNEEIPRFILAFYLVWIFTIFYQNWTGYTELWNTYNNLITYFQLDTQSDWQFYQILLCYYDLLSIDWNSRISYRDIAYCTNLSVCRCCTMRDYLVVNEIDGKMLSILVSMHIDLFQSPSLLRITFNHWEVLLSLLETKSNCTYHLKVKSELLNFHIRTDIFESRNMWLKLWLLKKL